MNRNKRTDGKQPHPVENIPSDKLDRAAQDGAPSDYRSDDAYRRDGAYSRESEDYQQGQERGWIGPDELPADDSAGPRKPGKGRPRRAEG